MMKYTSSRFLASSALMLLFTISGAYAQNDVSQIGTKGTTGVINSGNVSNYGVIAIGGSGSTGTGASVSIGATGAVGSVSSSAIQSKTAPNVKFGTIKQKVLNVGTIKNSGDVNVPKNSSLATGASVSVSATGAAAGVSQMSVESPVSVLRTDGSIRQTAQNLGTSVNNESSNKLNGLTLAGNGASVSIGATGGAASISSTSIDGLGVSPKGGLNIKGHVSQVSGNYAKVENAVAKYNGPVNVGNLAGVGTSVQISATGAQSSLSASSINSGEVSLRTGKVTQAAQNLNPDGGVSVSNKGDISARNLNGPASSLNIAAVGASSSLGASSIKGGKALMGTGKVTQKVQNLAKDGVSVKNEGTITAGNLTGLASSLSVTAVGASSSLSQTSVDGGSIKTKVAGVDQTVVNGSPDGSSSGSIKNKAADITAGSLTGTASSIQVASIGASAGVSQSSIAPTGKSASSVGVNLGPVTQKALNNAAIKNTGSVEAGVMSGTASSIGISAVGASASLGESSINGGKLVMQAKKVTQIVRNLNSGGGVSVKNKGTITAGNLTGLASSLSATAVGASSSLSQTSVGGGSISANVAGVDQTVINGTLYGSSSGLIKNTATDITAGSLTGTASSIQVASIGASASVSLSSIVPAGNSASFGGVKLGTVTQKVGNSVAIDNFGTVQAGMVSGTASSIGVSATGASASVSFSAIGR